LGAFVASLVGVAGDSVVLAVPEVPVLAVDALDGPDDAVVSADATPYPVAIAVPTPNATASPPTRPIWVAAPMVRPSVNLLPR
jgi:hypothetical protein